MEGMTGHLIQVRLEMGKDIRYGLDTSQYWFHTYLRWEGSSDKVCMEGCSSWWGVKGGSVGGGWGEKLTNYCSNHHLN